MIDQQARICRINNTFFGKTMRKNNINDRSHPIRSPDSLLYN